MKTININSLLRQNIQKLKPYSSARDEFSGSANVFLDANENPFNEPYNRYPDPLQMDLKQKIGSIKGVKPENIFTGNGSDEAIDLLIRAFCKPGTDNIVTIEPSYGMYQVSADTNDITLVQTRLTEAFQLNTSEIINNINDNTKLIFLCSPNNPTGNLLNTKDIKQILDNFNGLVVVDEAYIDFANDKGLVPLLPDYENLVVLQTFSKAWGLAGIRLGIAIASKEIINVLNKIKYPYNINILTQQKASKAVDNYEQKQKWVKEIIEQRSFVINELTKLKTVEKIHPSDANFILVKIKNARKVYESLMQKGIIVRDRSKVVLCDNCLRITIGTQEENLQLLKEITKLAEI